jgi:RND family efflux transporter MFP subunit
MATSLAILLGAAACGGHQEARGPAPAAIDVTATRVAPAEFHERHEAGGILQARQTAALTSRVMAPVETVTVLPGDAVRAGQVVVTLDVRDLTAQARLSSSSVEVAGHGLQAAQSEREAAEAALTLSQASYQRLSGLVERKSATAQELDEATASLRSGRARVATANARVAEATAALARAKAASDAAAVHASYGAIVAPFNGRVTEKLVEVGNMAAPGVPLLRVESIDGFRVHVRLDESRAAGIAPGQHVDVRLGGAEGADRRTDGTVAEIARAIDADARAFLVKIDLPVTADTNTLRSGMFARVQFPGPVRTALVVPPGAVIRQGQVATLFVVEKDVARLRIVQLGPAAGEGIEILAGLEPGEQIVTQPPPGLTDGQPVRVTGSAGKDRS